MHATLRHLLVASMLASAAIGSAQVAFGGKPIGLLARGPRLPEPPQITLPQVDAVALMAEDHARYASGIKGPWRFGYNHEVNISSTEHGTWTTLRNGDAVWRISIACPGAYAINFRFNEFTLPIGGRVFVYNDAGDVLGAFTKASAPKRDRLGVGQIAGARIIIEYHEPRAAAGMGRLRIDRVTHAYRDPFKLARDLGDSGPCNINVICPEGDGWRDQIRSVGIITTGGSGFCTGAMLNNCAQDSTPYFLTANHCLSADVEDWVFRFNWDSPTCDPTENGPIDQTVSGCVLLTSNSGTDMAFLELDAIPPAAYNVYYAGWDKTGATPDSVCGIHHPSGDIKKISLATAPFNTTNIDVGSGPADCWQVPVWGAGTTEPGSSGSPLFNQSRRVIGQLYGGSANCTNSVNDYYGRFDLSWPFLEQYLGSCGDTLNGLGENEIPVVHDAAITSIVNIPELICGDSVIAPVVTLKNNGLEVMTSAVITYGLVGGAPNVFNWTGSLQVQQTMNVALPPIVAPNGTSTLMVTSSWPNANEDQVIENDAWAYTFTVASPGGNISLLLTLDNWGSDITWHLNNDQGVLLYSGGPYPDLQAGVEMNVPFCLGTGCYTFTISDFFGDGICCEEGEGSYMIIDADSTALVESDGQYGEGETRDFCVVVVGVDEISTAVVGLDVFPHPARDILNLRASSLIQRARVLDALGRVVIDTTPRSSATTMSLEHLAGGAYTIEALTATGRAVRRLIVQR